MSHSAYRPRSSFDDPSDADPSYRVGRAFADLWTQVRGSAPEAIPEQIPERLRQYFPDRVQAYVRAYQHYRDVYEPRQQARQAQALRLPSHSMPPRRRRGGLRSSLRKFGRVRRGRYGNRMRTRRRQVFGRRATISKLRGRSRRFGRKLQSKRAHGRVTRYAALHALRSVLYPPVKWMDEGTLCVNNVGDDLQAKCSWWCFPMSWTNSQLISGAQSVAEQKIASIATKTRFCLEKAQQFMQFKNMSNARADVTVYKVYPKRDIPAGMPQLTGVNSAQVQEWFQEDNNPQPVNSVGDPPVTIWAGLRLQSFDEHDADVIGRGNSGLYRIKKVMRKFLEPGQFVILKHTDRKPKLISKAQYGVDGSGSWSDQYDHLKELGGFYLFRVQGSATHNNSLVVPPLTNAQLGATMGGYNVEFYYKRMFQMRQFPDTYIERTGVVSAELPTFDLADEKGWEVRQPNNADMRV